MSATPKHPKSPDARGARSLHRLVGRLVELAKREHHNCEEDTWYGCPLSRDGCARDIPKECDCGAETHNAEVLKLAGELETLLAKLPNSVISRNSLKDNSITGA